jgi:hypothetical protein
MANEFRHKDQGTSLTQAEFENIDAHLMNSQATGDTIVASSATQLIRRKNNISASDAPDANDDTGSGYTIGSVWLDLTNDKAYIALDVTSTAAVWNAMGGGAPSTVNYLVGTADGGLSAEIVVGTAPGGELGNTWASPTVDSTHSGSAHHTDAHTVVSHSDTTGTGAELNTLTDGSTTTLHAHSGGGGAVTREGGNTTEASSTSTSVVDLFTMASLTIAATEPFELWASTRKDAGAADNVGFGLKINATIVGIAATTTGVEGFGSSSGTGQIETLLLRHWFGSRVANYVRMGDGAPSQWRTSAGTVGATRQANKIQTADIPAVSITAVILDAITDNSGITMAMDEGHVYSYDDGV